MKRIATLFLLFICLACLNGCKVKFDYMHKYDELITRTYSKETIQELKEAINYSIIDFNYFKKHFKAECVRKTFQDYYYVVLLQDDGSRVFVLFEDDLDRIDEVYVYDEFKSKDDFDFALPNKTVRTQILEEDSNERVWPVSGSYDLYTSHVVKEGIMAFKYKRYEDGRELDNGGLLTEKVFVPNDEVENIWNNGTVYDEHYLYIYDMDKE